MNVWGKNFLKQIQNRKTQLTKPIRKQPLQQTDVAAESLQDKMPDDVQTVHNLKLLK